MWRNGIEISGISELWALWLLVILGIGKWYRCFCKSQMPRDKSFQVVNRKWATDPEDEEGWISVGDVDSVWVCVVMPFGSTVKKASRKVVEGFY